MGSKQCQCKLAIVILVKIPLPNVHASEIQYCISLSFQRPLTLSEELTDFAHKINFHGEEGNEIFKNGDDEVEDDETVAKEDQVKTEKWPWESVRSKLRYLLLESLFKETRPLICFIVSIKYSIVNTALAYQSNTCIYFMKYKSS